MRAAAGFLLLLSVGAVADAQTITGRAHSSFVLQNESDGWTVTYNNVRLATLSITVDGRPHLLFPLAYGAPADSGLPLLPREALSLGIPYGDRLSVELVSPVYEESPVPLLAPCPVWRRTSEGESIALYRKNVQAYASNRFYPDREIWCDPPVLLRAQNIAVIHLSPFRYDPATKILRRLVKGTIRVRLLGTGGGSVAAAKSAAADDPHSEPIYKSMVANYAQAKPWRVGLKLDPDSDSDPTWNWIVPAQSYCRVPLTDDGWYRVTPAELAAAGAPIASKDTASLSVWFRGKEIPIVVRPDSSIEFYGRRNYGDSTYDDFFTDTSAYWLTWRSGHGRRYAAAPPVTGPATAARISGTVTLHREENTDYYEGTSDAELVDNGTAPGEGWLWEYYYPGSTFSHTFVIDSLDTSFPTAQLRARLFGTTSTSNPAVPNHRAHFWVNDSLAGDATFAERSEGLLNVGFPTRWLKQGTNTLRIQSDPPPQNVINQFYLDWFEVDYAHILRATADCSIFDVPASPGVIASFTVSGFTSPAIDVYELNGSRMIGGGVVTGGDATGYTIVFQDSLSSAHRYVVTVPAGGARPVLSVSSKTFKNIRVNQQGADYLIVTHHDFLGAAQQLAAQREAVNGVRTAVVDVQDIYDEFNFGVMNDDAMKSFVRYAYEQWRRPAPLYLLFLGDASWDYHGYLSTTVKKNYVPSHGVPSGDNWFGCFDSRYPFIPSLLIGRLPVENAGEAQSTVAKMIQYDATVPADWVKSFLFISGGTTPSEQATFNSICDGTVATYLTPPPIGGYTYKVYKSTPNTIDGENTQLLQGIVQSGVCCINFLGHSGGRIWGVDIGSPDDLQNTNGRLPFVTSVSCNVGAFADPRSSVLSEDFVLANNRGAVGVWASSSIGYSDIGPVLVNYFFDGVVNDSLRGFGELTTDARYRFWLSAGSDYRTIASVNLNPLLGDPLSRLVVPLKPDLAVASADIHLDTNTPSPNDSALTLSTLIRNYGLVPSDSVGIVMTDLYNGQTSPVFAGRIGPTRFKDSVAVRWRGTSQIGLHTIRVAVDPADQYDEVTKANNVATADFYVYANLLYALGPLRDQVVPPAPQLLRVSSPIGADSADMQIVFQLDTASTFSTPFLVSSGPITPGPVSAQWMTPSLQEGKVYYWRARALTSSVQGAWLASAFSTSSVLPSAPLLRWRENTAGLFGGGVMAQTAVTDSGVAIGSSHPISIEVRSLGNRADINNDYYSTLRLEGQSMAGLWWVNGSGFMGLAVDAFSGDGIFKAFDVPSTAAQADTLAHFISTTPTGNYIALTVIFDGRTNVNAALRTAIKSLGSTLIDSVQPGDAWSIIGRKGSSGPGMVPLEHWSRTGITQDSLQVPNYYSFGRGSFDGTTIPMPQRLAAFRWTTGTQPGITSVRAALLGIRANGTVDTLRIVSQDSTAVDLSALHAITVDSSYVRFRPAALLASSDALQTPVLRDWSVDYEPPADLAVSWRTLSSPKISLQKAADASVTLTVYNVGYRTAASASVVLSLLQADNTFRPIASTVTDSIPAGGSRTVQIPFATDGFPSSFTVQARVTPPSGQKELLWENNTSLYRFLIVGIAEKLSARVQVYADGVMLMDGDYVAARPRIAVRLAELSGPATGIPRVDLFVDGGQVFSSASLVAGETGGTVRDGDLLFSPLLSSGSHELRIRVAQMDAAGQIDSLVRTVGVTVENDYKILQMFNYPNPFRSDTWFTFVLTGARPPEDLTVRIFTVAGRKIRELRAVPGSLQVGFNRLYWDGRDTDGDDVANGYYLYQVQIRGEGNTGTSLGKLARIR